MKDAKVKNTTLSMNPMGIKQFIVISAISLGKPEKYADRKHVGTTYKQAVKEIENNYIDVEKDLIKRVAKFKETIVLPAITHLSNKDRNMIWGDVDSPSVDSVP